MAPRKQSHKKHLIPGKAKRVRYVWAYGTRNAETYEVATWFCPHCNGEVYRSTHKRTQNDRP